MKYNCEALGKRRHRLFLKSARLRFSTVVSAEHFRIGRNAHTPRSMHETPTAYTMETGKITTSALFEIDKKYMCVQ